MRLFNGSGHAYRRSFFTRIAPIGILLFAIPVICLSGCGMVPTYSYESIRSEYTKPIRAASSGTPARRPVGDASADPLDTPLSLDQAIAIAFRNNPELTRAAMRVRQALAMCAMADAAFWPQVSFYTEYTQGDAPSAYLFKTIDQRQLPPTVDFNDPGWFENWESGLKGQVNLFKGGRDYLGLRMAETDLELARFDRVRMENTLTAELIRTFYNVLAARDFIAIAEASVATVSEQLRIMRVRYEGGGAVKSDVLSMDVRLAQAREQLIRSQNRYRLTRAALANLMGLDPSALADTDDPLDPSGAPAPEMPDTYDAGIAYALEHRPELAAVRAQLVKSRMGVTAARAAYLPRLDLRGSYYLDDPSLDYDTDRENWTTALLLNWDLFTGFSRGPGIARADAMVREMLAADRQAVLDITLDVKTAYLNREETAARLDVAQSSVQSAEESFRLVREHFLGGAVTITRYLEAELDLSQARIRATAARYDTQTAEADVARALGIWTVTKPQPMD